MTTTERINAMNDLLSAINADLRNNPRFTMTHTQLNARIYHYLDCPAATAADYDSIRRMLCPMIHCFRD